MPHYVSEQVAVTPEFSVETFGNGDEVMKLSDLINALNDMWNKIPLEKQADARVYADTSYNPLLEETTATMMVHYSRQETETEEVSRLERERQEAIWREEKLAAIRLEEENKRKDDYADYLRLRAIFEGK